MSTVEAWAAERSSGDISAIDQSMAPPADREEPGPGTCDGRCNTTGRSLGCARYRPFTAFPSIEPPRRGCRIQECAHATRTSRHVVSCVQQHVPKRVPHLPRGRQQPHVITIGEHASRAPGDAIHGPSHPRPDRLHASREGALVICFDDQVGVISLQGVVHQPKPRPIAGDREALLDLPYDRHRAQRRTARAHAQRHMCRNRSSELVAFCVGHPAIWAPLSTGTGARTAPCRPRAKRQVELSRMRCHLEFSYVCIHQNCVISKLF